MLELQPNVFIVGGDYNIEKMFAANGWRVTRNFDKADVVQFTGGSDVSPELYGERKHPETYNSPERDKFEKELYQQARHQKKVLAGICRGGQFLNVMNGGSMWQHIPDHSHCSGPHTLYTSRRKAPITATSTHHQMIRPSPKAELVGWAYESDMSLAGHPNGDYDVEIVIYRETKSLCFQPHPEYCEPYDKLPELYLELIKELI